MRRKSSRALVSDGHGRLGAARNVLPSKVDNSGPLTPRRCVRVGGSRQTVLLRRLLGH